MTVLVVIAVGLGVLLLTGSHVGVAFVALDREPMDLESRPGLDNRPPPELRARLSNLAKCAAVVTSLGLRVTSAYRSAATTETIFGPAIQAPEHAAGCALDVAPPKPTTEPALLEMTQKALLDSSLGPHIERAIVETDHVHVAFSTAYLDGA